MINSIILGCNFILNKLIFVSNTIFILNFNIYNSLILIGIIQGIVFGFVVLFSKKYHSRSTFFLVAVILGISFSNLQYYLSDTGILTNTQMFSTIYLPWASLNPVLIYFYVITFLYPSKKTTLKSKLLYIPFIIFFLLIIPYKIAVVINYSNTNFYYFYGLLSNFHELFSIVFTLLIMIALFIKIARFEKLNQHFNKDQIHLKLLWLKATLILMTLLLLTWGVLMYKTITSPNISQSFYVLWIGVSIVIYWLGHIGIYNFGILNERRQIRNSNTTTFSFVKPKTKKNEHLIDLEKLLIDEKQFLNPVTNLDSVAKELGLSKSYLSRIINNELNISFTDYLNSIRVEKAKEFLQNSEFLNYTLVAIGLESGFNSKSTFYTAFKKFTKLTPSEFKKKYAKSSV